MVSIAREDHSQVLVKPTEARAVLESIEPWSEKFDGLIS